MQLLLEKCPEAVKTLDLKTYTGRSVACDASMVNLLITKAIYQFLISTQHVNKGFGISELKDKDGNLTGHLMGIFNRSIQLMENGVRPCWVFDGKPPDLKKRVLDERKKRKQMAEASKSEAADTGDLDKALKMANQSVKITSQMLDDAKRLVRLLGLPVVEVRLY
jgi:flap endonuclease-1